MPVFVDTGGWFAYFVRRDLDHMAAVDWMRQNRQPLVTTDYVPDELFTLLKLRESHRVAAAAGAALLDQSMARLEWIGNPDFRAAWEGSRIHQLVVAFHQLVQKLWNYCNILREGSGIPPYQSFCNL